MFVLTYNFDLSIFTESFDSMEEAEEKLNSVLDEELQYAENADLSQWLSFRILMIRNLSIPRKNNGMKQ